MELENLQQQSSAKAGSDLDDVLWPRNASELKPEHQALAIATWTSRVGMRDGGHLRQYDTLLTLQQVSVARLSKPCLGLWFHPGVSRRKYAQDNTCTRLPDMCVRQYSS